MAKMENWLPGTREKVRKEVTAKKGNTKASCVDGTNSGVIILIYTCDKTAQNYTCIYIHSLTNEDI